MVSARWLMVAVGGASSPTLNTPLGSAVPRRKDISRRPMLAIVARCQSYPSPRPSVNQLNGHTAAQGPKTETGKWPPNAAKQPFPAADLVGCRAAGTGCHWRLVRQCECENHTPKPGRVRCADHLSRVGQVVLALARVTCHSSFALPLLPYPYKPPNRYVLITNPTSSASFSGEDRPILLRLEAIYQVGFASPGGSFAAFGVDSRRSGDRADQDVGKAVAVHITRTAQPA